MNGIYLILDPEQTAGRPVRGVAEVALRAGIDMVQWRQKGGLLAATWQDLLAIRDLCQSYGVPFLINDRVDLALAVGADGAHVGQDDLPATAARQLLPGRILGVSITDISQVGPAEQAGADYLGVGPIFITSSKADAVSALGLDFLHSVRRVTDLPIVAIGGIGVGNAPQVLEAGADAVAVISAICGADDVEVAVRGLADKLGRSVPR